MIPIGATVRIVDPHVQHYGKVGEVVPLKRWMPAGVNVRFVGDQRAWHDAGDEYDIDYAEVQVELVVEEVQASLW
jgi:hypothetical protein